MNKTQNEDTSKTKPQAEKSEKCCCPFCFSMRVVEETKKRHSDFFVHLHNAQIELLRAFRSVLDGKITSLEKQKKKVTRVSVE